MRIVASSNSDFVRYSEYATNIDNLATPVLSPISDLELDISGILQQKDINFFYPFTTTLVEIRLQRQTLNPLVQFLGLS